MRIIVTGSSGKIGSASVAELLRHGHEVVPIDVRPLAVDGAPATHLLDLATADLLPLFKGADAVCHLGNYPGFAGSGEPKGFANNLSATYNVFYCAFQAGIRRIVNASSLQAYGVVGNVPMPPVYLPIDEDHPHLAADGYSLSKSMSESIAQSFVRREPGLSVFSLRFTAVVDPSVPWPAPRPGAKRHRGIAGSMLTYVPVKDAARAVRLCCELQRPGHTALNIVSPRPWGPWSEEILRETWGTVPPFRRALAPAEALVAHERAREIIGFVAGE